tara:strand:- start:22280 stop:24289 length:2010 start_codon:yes stop_codon:yes gene_type:complete
MSTFTVSAVFKAIDQFTRPLQKMERSTRTFAQSSESVLANANRAFRKLTPTIGGLTKDLMKFAAVAAVGSILLSGANAAKDFEVGMASLSAITGVTGNGLIAFQDQVNKVAKDTKTGSVEMTKAFELVGSAKPELLKSAEALGAVAKAAVVMSQASRGELEVSVQSLTGTLNQFELGADSALMVIDALAAGSQAGAAAIPQITESLDKFGTVAKSMNLDVFQSIGLIETLAEKNIKGAEAGTKLRNVLTKMATANALPPEALKQLEKYGVSTDIVSNSSLSLEKRLKELSKIQGDATALSKVFGLENLVAGQIILQNVDKVSKFTEAVKQTGVAQEQADKNTSTLSSRLEQLSNRWENLFTTSEKVNGVISIFKGLLVFVADNIETLVGVGLTYVGLLVGLKAITIGITLYTGLFSISQGILAGVMGTSALAFEAGTIAYYAYRAATLATTAATWLFNAALYANPIGLVIIGIVALVAAVYWLTDGFKGFGDFFIGLWNGLVNVFNWYVDTILGSFNFLADNIMALFNYLNPVEVLRENLNAALPGLGDDVIDFFGGMFKSIYMVFIEPLVMAWNLVAGAFGKKIDTSGLDAVSSKMNGLDKTINANANVNVDEATINAQNSRQENLVRTIEERNQNLNIDINDGTRNGVSVRSEGDSIAMPNIKPSFI